MTSRALSLLLICALIAPLLVAQALPPKASSPKASSDDDRIYDEVRRRLANDVDVKGAGFEVAVKNGVVTLKGRVHTDKARAKAASITKKVKGVTSVDNQLKLFGTDD